MHSRPVPRIIVVCLLTFVGSVHLASTASAQALLWEDRFAAGQDPAARVAVGDSQLFVAGKAPAATGSSTGWLVRSYDPRTGTVLWQDAFSGANGSENKAQAVIVSGGTVFAGGFASSTLDLDVAMLRAYNAQTGVLQWQDQFTSGGDFASVNSLAIETDQQGQNKRLFAAGRGLKSGVGGTEWFVRAYDPVSGLLLWQTELDHGIYNDALSVVVRDGRVFVSGFTTEVSKSARHFTLQAYDAGTGMLLWQDRVPSGRLGFSPGDGASQVAVEDDRVVAAGIVTDEAGFHFAVRVYHSRTGTLLWKDLVNTGAGADFAQSLSLSQGRAFVAGTGGPNCNAFVPSDCDWLIRAYDQKTGALIWQKQVDSNHQDDDGNVVVVCGNRVVVGGAAGTNSASAYADWRVQVLDAGNGDMVWEDRLSTGNVFAAPSGLAVDGNRLFVTGSTLDLFGGTQNGDYIVRAHEFSSEPGCTLANNTGTR